MLKWRFPLKTGQQNSEEFIEKIKMVQGELGYPAITRLEVDLTLFQPLRVPKERKLTTTNYKCHTQCIFGIVHPVKKTIN